LERVIWKTECWIDGNYIGSAESLSAAHQFNLGNLKAGKHTIILKIDNTKQHDISFNDFAHAYTDGTQIIWNGVIGQIRLDGIDQHRFSHFQLYPDAVQKSVSISLSVKDVSNYPGAKVNYKIFDKNKLVAVKVFDIQTKDNNIITNKLNVNDAKLWDEFNPNLYRLTAELIDKKGKVITSKTTSFGFRKLASKNGHLTLNDKRIFLRGTLDCNIYPITGYPPMDKAGWTKVFKVVKDYGLNHIRYHSWCPPEAAFQVADSLGMYLQVELPLWSLKVGQDKATTKFLEDEAQKIMASYGNHPSFCFFSMGNELEGDFDWLNSMVAKLKKDDNRRLYTATTFTFQKGHGLAPEPNDDFFITQYTKKGWIRGQGVFNAEVPNFDKDYQANASGLNVPLISHEIGQYSVFPNLKEIEKYKGVLDPLNLKAIRHDMQKKGLIALADSFKLASGKFATLLYREEIERALKTDAFSGFQLLDLHDFPGQSTALVGLLDAFWESKGLISPKEFRMFSSEVVPLLKYKKASYLNNEPFLADIVVANFGKKVLNGNAIWRVKDQQGKVLFSGKTALDNVGIGTSTIGKVKVDLTNVTQASQLMFSVEIENTAYQNSWDFWVYPKSQPVLNASIVFTTSKQEAYVALALGKTVVLNPDTAEINGIPGRFTSVFWSPVHFPDQPGSMGILCNPKHPAFAEFPTTFYSNWQWWGLITNSKSLVLDELTEQQQPIVRVIDNFNKNRKLGTLIEAKVGKGKLLLCTMDISTNLEERIDARQFKNSILKYAGESSFNPKATLSTAELDRWLK
ncbi:MAG: glycoside hydrolase family 2, partial [Pedobacter sp.]